MADENILNSSVLREDSKNN